MQAAKENCDKHVCKIILEATQMLCLAHWYYGFPNLNTAPRELSTKMPGKKTYKYQAQTHNNNHVTRWVRESLWNYEWTTQHGIALCNEYKDRYAHNLLRKGISEHACRPILEWFAANVPAIPKFAATPFRQAVAENCYTNGDVVLAYRLYYLHCKAKFAKWRLGNIPAWFKQCNPYLV